ncbi:MAG: hypothetical protein H0T14_01730 [Nocardioidaceae bacterium]|nr:hypothetical protein [Nocardioidaceae bacterium]
MDFDTTADELYALPLTEFTAARNDRVRQARGVGDRDLASRIQSLRKPTVAAWLTNQLVRSCGDEMQALLELGGELREVMAELSGDELRELTKQRHQVVSALVQQARSLGHTLGQPVSDEVAWAVRETLEATLSDSVSADAVAAGRLIDPLQVSGFGVSDGAPPGTQPALGRRTEAGSGAGGTVSDLDAKRQERDAREQREQAQRAVEVSTRILERARTTAARADHRLQKAQTLRSAAAEAVERIRDELDEAVAELEAKERSLEATTRESKAARAKLNEAQRALTESEVVLQALPQPRPSDGR